MIDYSSLIPKNKGGATSGETPKNTTTTPSVTTTYKPEKTGAVDYSVLFKDKTPKTQTPTTNIPVAESTPFSEKIKGVFGINKQDNLINTTKEQLNSGSDFFNSAKNLFKKKETPVLDATLLPDAKLFPDNFIPVEPTTDIKVPFANKEISIQQKNVISDLAKYGIELPEKVARTYTEAFGLTPESTQRKGFSQFLQSYSEKAKEYTAQALDDSNGAVGASIILGSARALGDFANDALIYADPLGKAGQSTALEEKLFKNVIETHSMPKTMYFEGSKVQQLIAHGDLTNPETADLIKVIGGDSNKIRNAFKNGITIQIPSEKIVSLQDKPYWSKIKSYFGVESDAKILSKTGGQASETVRGYLPEKTATIPEPTINNPFPEVPQQTAPEKFVPPVEVKSETPIINTKIVIPKTINFKKSLDGFEPHVIKDSWGNPYWQIKGKPPEEITSLGDKLKTSDEHSLESLAGDANISLETIGESTLDMKHEKPIKTIEFNNDSIGTITVNKKYYDVVKSTYPNSEPFISAINKPVVFKENGKIVGLVMPLDAGIIKENKIKTKSELKPQENALIQEAKKYKSADEFINSQKPVYHGTLAKFDNFDAKKVGSNTEWDNAKFGTFFLDDAQKAKEFPELARMTGDNRPVNVKQVYIELKNPIDFTIEGIFSNEKQAPTIIKILGTENGKSITDPKKALQYINDNIDLGDIGDLKDALYGDIKNKKIIQDAGYDGIISDYGDGITEKVVFDTNQIKTKSQLTDIWNKAHEKVSTETQKEKVLKTIKESPKTIKQIAEETKILEPNVRRILGVGAKDGTFERIDKGVYTLSKNGKDLAWVETGNAVESLPRLAKDGFKADMVFLDIPYNTPAVKGGNRGVNYNLVSVDDFSKVLDAVKIISKTDNSPIIHMYSQAESGMKAMQKYNDLFIEKGFIPVGKGQYQKTFADGSPTTSPNGKIAKPEGILVFTKSGELDKNLGDLNFTLRRPKGYQTEKPAEMLKSMIEMTTNEGDIVLDPFAGSGVTGAEAIRAGRKAYLIEKDLNVAKNITGPRVKQAVDETTKEFNVAKNGKLIEVKNKVKSEPKIINKEKVQNLTTELINIYKNHPNTQEEFNNIMGALDMSEAGYRYFNSTGVGTEVTGVGSTFPKWLPEDLRSKDLFDKVMGEVKDIIDLKYPQRSNANTQRLLANEIFARLDNRLGINTSGIRADILKEYGQDKVIDYKAYEGNKGRGEETTKGIEKVQKIDIKISSLENEIANGEFSGNLSTEELATKRAELEKLLNESKGQRGTNAIADVTAGKPIGEFENIPIVNTPLKEYNLKLFEKTKELINKYAKNVGEGYLPSHARGIYHPETENIRVNGMNNLSTASHEIAHFIDFEHGITKDLLKVVGYTKDGKPMYDKYTFGIRKDLKDVYMKFYGGKEWKPLKTKIIEGFASFVQQYASQPLTITKLYPSLVKDFFEVGGKFYNEKINSMIADVRQIAGDYQALDSLDKIGARIANDDFKTEKDSFFNLRDRFRTFTVDNIYPLEKLAIKGNIANTVDDPSLWARQYNGSNGFIVNNLKGSKGMWTLDNNSFKKVNDENWGDLMKKLEKRQILDKFGSYLVARDQYFGYKELDKLKEDFISQAGTLKDMKTQYDADVQSVGPEQLTEDLSMIKQMMKEVSDIKTQYQELKKVLESNLFTRTEVENAYLENKDNFKDEETLFDALEKVNLDILHDSEVGLLNSETYNNLTKKQGYAPLKRQFYDEIVGDETMMGKATPGTKKVSSMISRKGSSRTIINPVLSAMKDHAEIVKKAMKQVVYNKVAKLALTDQFPELFQKQELKAIPDANTGVIHYPQEKDSNIIMARINGKRVPILTDGLVKKTLEDILTYENISDFEKMIMASNRLFTKGTTGIFPGFALTNFAVDQITASAQTQTKYIPIFSAMNELGKSIFKQDSQEAKFFEEYMVLGGERQTFVGWQDMSAREVAQAIAKERTGLLKVADVANKGMDVLALPAKYSEITTRASEYIRSRKGGDSQIVALEKAGRVTAPFHHTGTLGGRFGKTFVKSIPFFNPALQVLDQSIRSGSGKNTAKRFLFVYMAVTTAIIASQLNMMEKGSDEQKQAYKDLSQREKAMYLYFPSSDGKTFIKVRVPQEFTTVGAITNQMIADRLYGTKYTAGEYFDTATSFLPNQFQIDPQHILATGWQWIPQIAKPALLVSAGKSDFPKIRDLESMSMQNRSPENRYYATTSPVAKWLGKQFGLSPIKIDYLIQGYAGRASKFITGPYTLKTYNPLSTLTQTPNSNFGRTFDKFYTMKKENDQKYYDIKHKTGSPVKIGERTTLLRERNKLKVISGMMDNFNKIDEVKYPERANKLKVQIIKQIDKL